MKVRGLKQVFHWLFLIVGIFSLVMLGITVNTYLGYAQEGYGLKMSFDQASMNGNWLVLKFYVENPGGMDIEITRGNLTLSDTYNIPHTMLPNGLAQEYPLTKLPAGENTSVIIWIPISEPDLGNIQMHHEVDLDLKLELWVPERFMNTELPFQAIVEVEI
ncbi:MAG: hypothetical protein KAJ33_07910 [Thermoplasmata archaeon]|nr:hypothetical protein [Thermoplasmata archaeon]